MRRNGYADRTMIEALHGERLDKQTTDKLPNTLVEVAT